MLLIIQLSETPPNAWFYKRGLSGKVCEVTETILSLRPYDMQEKDFRFLLTPRSHPEYFSRYLPVFLESPGIDQPDLLCFAWDSLVGSLSLSLKLEELNDVHIWVPAFQYLINQGIDIHRVVCRAGRSAYGRLLLERMHAFEADGVAYFWLKILKTCGVDIQSYVQIESTLIEKDGTGGYENQRERQMVILDFEGLPMLSWRWELPTESKIIELLQEFHNLGPESFQHGEYHFFPSGSEDFKYWSVHINQYGCWGKISFPYILAPIDCIRGMDDYRLDGLWCRQTYNRAVEIRDSRLARRQAKNWRKAHPGEKPPSRTMPGAWVD